MKFVMATHNKGKVAELQVLMDTLGIEIVLPEDVGFVGDVEENGETFTENARIKAKTLMEATGLPAIGDDSGLCVDALNGGPGIYSARYGGLEDDLARCKLLLANMQGSTTRAAHFHTSIVCVFPNGDEIIGEGDCHGAIAFAPMGDRGFGYDPIFIYPEYHKTFAQVSLEEKNAISHRANALKDFAPKLEEYLKTHGD